MRSRSRAPRFNEPPPEDARNGNPPPVTRESRESFLPSQTVPSWAVHHVQLRESGCEPLHRELGHLRSLVGGLSPCLCRALCPRAARRESPGSRRKHTCRLALAVGVQQAPGGRASVSIRSVSGSAPLAPPVWGLDTHFAMTAADIGTLRELVGPWSRLVLAAGFAGACVSCLARRRRPRPGVTVPNIVGWIAAGMYALGAFIVLWVLPLSSGYSGPVPSEIRHLRDYDKYLATLTALVLATVFAFEAYRSRRTAK
jgi:hypothetical protein